MVDSTSILHFTRDRTLIPGPAGHTISGPDWLDVTTRLSAVEGIAATTNPYMPPVGTYMSTSSHGLGGEIVTGQLLAENVLWTPIFLPEAVTTQWLGVHVVTPQTGASLNIGLYDASQSLLGYCNVAGTTSGIKLGQLSAPVVVPAGMNWLGVHLNNVNGVEIQVLYNGMALYYVNGAWTHVLALKGSAAHGPMPAMSAVDAPWGGAPVLWMEVTS